LDEKFGTIAHVLLGLTAGWLAGRQNTLNIKCSVGEKFRVLHVPYGTNFLQGQILMNGHLENIDEKILTNSIMLMPTFINGWRD